MRTITKYQATFQGATPAAQFQFQFQRIYKQAPHHKFLIRCTNISDYRAGSLAVNPHNYFVQGFLGDGHCSFSGIVAEGLISNDFFIGTTSTNGAEATTPTNIGTAMNYQANDLIVDDIPLNPFTLVYRHTASTALASGLIEVLVSFEITEFDPSKRD